MQIASWTNRYFFTFLFPFTIASLQFCAILSSAVMIPDTITNQ